MSTVLGCLPHPRYGVTGLDFGILASRWGCQALLSLWLHLGPQVLHQQLSNLAVSLSSPDCLQEILQDKDGLNQRYFRKRALYLAYLAHHLANEIKAGVMNEGDVARRE